jgi:hypothetical protein
LQRSKSPNVVTPTLAVAAVAAAEAAAAAGAVQDLDAAVDVALVAE